VPTSHSSKKSRSPNAATPSAQPPVAPSASPAFVVDPPPPDATILSVPQGFVPVDITNFRGILPKAQQLAVLAGAVNELKDFPDYADVFGKTAPPYAAVVQAFAIASEWSALRKKIDAYDLYATTEEALAWKEVHDYMARMQPAFELAVKSDASVASLRPSLARLFGAAKEIGKKAAAARKANAQLKAEGKLPTKGKTGKRRRRVAAEALLAAATKTAAAGPTQPVAPAVVAPPTVGNGTNGTSHS
jgi:hypothetical protein